MLHASVEHIAANSIAILIRAPWPAACIQSHRARPPLLWLGSGLGAWMLGNPAAYLGASGVTHGLMFLLASRPAAPRPRGNRHRPDRHAVLRRHADDHPAARDGRVRQSHMGGAFAGIIAALLFRNADPPPRQRYSWEDEEDEVEPLADDELEPPSPQRVPVLWQPREGQDYVVIPFRRPDEPRG
jgi:hypothetical protein